jgi:hypothetical protein
MIHGVRRQRPAAKLELSGDRDMEMNSKPGGDERGTHLLGESRAFLPPADQNGKRPTRPVAETGESLPAPSLEPGTASFTDRCHLVLDLGEARQQVVISEREQITIGRVDGLTSVLPTIDLSRQGGWERGVSRLHAAIQRLEDRLYLIDLGSTNGTFLNGRRIESRIPHLLHDCDHVRLGLFDIEIHFQQGNGDIGRNR